MSGPVLFLYYLSFSFGSLIYKIGYQGLHLKIPRELNNKTMSTFSEQCLADRRCFDNHLKVNE